MLEDYEKMIDNGIYDNIEELCNELQLDYDDLCDDDENAEYE